MTVDSFERTRASLNSEQVDVITRQLEGGQVFHLAAPNGRCQVWAERFYDIEPELLDFFTVLQPTDVYWDIGCSISHFAIYAVLTRGCQAFGFEPEAQNFSLSSLNCYLNRAGLAGRYTPLNLAVNDVTTLKAMYMRLYGAGEHTKSLDETSAATYSQPVICMTPQAILELGVRPPSVVKIDVDGNEIQVLEGLSALWPGVRALFIELPAAQLDGYSARLAAHGLQLRATHKVVRMRGGFYDEIINADFRRLPQD